MIPYRLVKRHETASHPLRGILQAAAFALLGGAVIMAAYGANPFTAYFIMFKGAFGSLHGLSEVVVKATPLTLTGLAVALAATMLLWNIGCEGQFVFGGIGAGWAALYLVPHLPEFLALPAVTASGMLAGMLWALIPAVLKAYRQVNEILTTLLLNYVAIILYDHLIFGPWRDPMGMGFPGTPTFPDAALYPTLPGTRIQLGVIFAVLLAAALHYLLQRSKWGFQIRVIGRGPKAAGYAGMNIRRNVLLVMGMSGALAGLAGVGEACGIHWRLQEGFATGYGFDGIIVACMARLNPRAVPAYAVLLGVLIVGSEQLQTAMRLPASFSSILEALLLLGLLGSDALSRYRIERIRPDASGSAAGAQG